jgi:hypothetical protein
MDRVYFEDMISDNLVTTWIPLGYFIFNLSAIQLIASF